VHISRHARTVVRHEGDHGDASHPKPLHALRCWYTRRFEATMAGMPALHGVLLYTARLMSVCTITIATTSRIRKQRIRVAGGVCVP